MHHLATHPYTNFSSRRMCDVFTIGISLCAFFILFKNKKQEKKEIFFQWNSHIYSCSSNTFINNRFQEQTKQQNEIQFIFVFSNDFKMKDIYIV